MTPHVARHMPHDSDMPDDELDEAALARAVEPPPDCVMYLYPDGSWGWRADPAMRRKIDEWKAAFAKAILHRQSVSAEGHHATEL
jgi:hypothetical protein